ncbi:MAG TPA: hypothetical protein VN081_03940 [Dongiaceae bacterium]|nr:hypothetical protein [Dongiaceae bacterium]
MDVTQSFTGIPAKFAQDADFQNFTSLDDVLGEFKTLKQLRANQDANGFINLIGEKSTPEEVNAFFEKLGKPKSAAEYGFKAPDNLPEGLDFSDERAAKFAELVHKHNLTTTQAQGLFNDLHSEILVPEFNSLAEMQTAQLESNFTELEKVWGQQGSPEFNKAHKNALKAFNYVADSKLAGAFKADPALASNPLVLQVLSRLGSKMGNDNVPTVHGVEPAGRFTDSLPAVDKAIKDFHSSGKFKNMMSGKPGPETANLKAEWSQLWSKKNELLQKGEV